MATPTIQPDTFDLEDYVPCAGGLFGTGACPPGHELPTVTGLVEISILNYQGAFRLPGNTFGASSLRYQQRAVIGYNNATDNLLIIGEGDANNEFIGEFSIPAIVREENGVYANLNFATNTQPFINVLDQDTNDGDFSFGRSISGIYTIGGEIFINYFSYYDNSPFNTDTTVIKRNAANINASTDDVVGSLKMTGACHASGWISQIPAEWQTALGGTHISGHSSSTTKTINTRHSVGPSAYVFTATDFTAPNNPAIGSAITAQPVLNYPIEHHLGIVTQGDLVDQRLNDAGTIWSNLSEAAYGFILPGTSTYMVIGGGGGFFGGITYKPVYPDGTTSAGHAPTVQGEYSNDYWLYDVNDLVAVKNGTMESWEPLPYSSGRFVVPFATTDSLRHRVTGASYDSTNQFLYVTISGIDNQGVGSSQPVCLQYTLDGV